MIMNFIAQVKRPIPLSCILHLAFIFWGSIFLEQHIAFPIEKADTLIEIQMTEAEAKEVEEIRKIESAIKEQAVPSVVPLPELRTQEKIIKNTILTNKSSEAVSAFMGEKDVGASTLGMSSGIGGTGSGTEDNIASSRGEGILGEMPNVNEASESLGGIADRFALLVDNHKKYPYLAVRKNQEGIVKVYAEISSEGALLHKGIVSSSGYESLDEAALKAVSKACPFSHGTGKNINITVPVHFRLQ